MDGEVMMGALPKGATFDLRNLRPNAPNFGLSDQDEEQDGDIAWVGLVLMLFSAAAMVGLTGWTLCSVLA